MQAAANRLPGPAGHRRRTNSDARPHLATADDAALLGALPIAAAVITQGKDGSVHILAHNSRFRETVAQSTCTALEWDQADCLKDGPIAELVAHRYLDPILATMPRPRGLVLGCTHFPVLKQTIARIAGAGVVLIDSAETTATAVEKILREKSLLHDGEAQPPVFLATDAPGRFAHLGEIFLGEPIDPGAVTLVDL